MRLLIIFFLSVFICKAQDTIYARKLIEQLCSKKCYGRGYLNNGLENAAKILKSEFKSIGCQPLFEKGYYQEFAFNVNTFPTEVNLKINGKIMEPGKDFIIAPESNNVDGMLTMKKKDSVTYINESHGFSFLISVKKKLTWSVATYTAPYAKVEVLESSLPPGVLIADVDINNKYLVQHKNNNICAYLNGTENNDTVIVFSAHYDHLGGMGKTTYFPGGNDNASGTSVVMNLAKYYVAHPPKYKTVFLLFAGEEAGLLGSKYFVENSPIDLKKIKFLMNLDLLGTGDDGIMLVNGAILPKQFELMQKINAEKNYVKEIQKRGKARNSDHYYFTEAGVPAFFLYTLGGSTFYHDVFDTAKSLSLRDYVDVCKLLIDFTEQL
jgi:aminopeptidase YwaD